MDSRVPADGNILSLVDLTGGFGRRDSYTQVLNGVTFAARAGVMTAIVGETGSGKSLTALTSLGIAPPSFRRTGGHAWFGGRDLFTLPESELRRLRGREISMVFQDARAALNPVFTVGHQLRDAARAHRKLTAKQADAEVEAMLERVRIVEPGHRMRQYPHEFSGGMAQRVMLAMALICQPKLLLLDEPTTGLDVTIQADVIELIVELVSAAGMSAFLITHDLGLVAESCQDVVVMRQGQVRETGSTKDIFTSPQDPYTIELINASRLTESAV
jgi:ABC-type dipeptide/oligopeptide/nickel transport system ATPase component